MDAVLTRGTTRRGDRHKQRGEEVVSCRPVGRPGVYGDKKQGPGGQRGWGDSSKRKGRNLSPPHYFAPGAIDGVTSRVRKTDSYKPRGPVFYTTKVVTVVSPQGAIQTRVKPPGQGGGILGPRKGANNDVSLWPPPWRRR